MTRLFWIDGRLPWPLVIVVAYVSASLVAADYVWRVLVVPFDTLLLYTVIVDFAIAIVMYAVYRINRRRA